MATQAMARRIALALPGAVGSDTDFAFHVVVKTKPKGFAWAWKQRIAPRQARVPSTTVLAVRVANLDDKALLLASDSDKFFTEDHYNGFPAVLVRLPKVTAAELRILLAEAWRCVGGRAP